MGRNQLPDKVNFLGADLAASINKFALHDRQFRPSNLERKGNVAFFYFFPNLGPLNLRCNRTPHRSRLSLVGVAVPEQQLELMHIQTQRGLRTDTGPPAKPALRKALLTKPVTLAIIAQNLQGP